MKLTEEQIQNLYNFVGSRHVEFYDVQTELVDHLAIDIEEIWKVEPNLSFLQVRHKSFKKFGVLGFSKIVSRKQKQLAKQYWKHAWQVFKQYFTFPKIILTFFLIALIYTLFDFIPDINLSLTIYSIILIVIVFAVATRNILKLKKRKKTTGKKWLFDSINSTLGGYIHVSQIFIQIVLYNESFEFTPTSQIILALVVTLVSIFSYILIRVVPRKIEGIYTKQYPEFKLLKKA